MTAHGPAGSAAAAADEKPIVIVGAGRLGRNVVLALESVGSGGRIAGFLDDTRAPGDAVMGHPILAGFAHQQDRHFVAAHRWFVAIGDNRVRHDLSAALADRGAAFVTVFQSTAEAARTAVIGRGVFAGPNVWIGADTSVGDWTVIEGASFIGNDIVMGTAAFLGPAVVLTGGASVGDRSFIGAATVISNEVAVGADCVVGAHSLVLRDLPDGTTAHGVPARPAPLDPRPFRPGRDRAGRR